MNDNDVEDIFGIRMFGFWSFFLGIIVLVICRFWEEGRVFIFVFIGRCGEGT